MLNPILLTRETLDVWKFNNVKQVAILACGVRVRGHIIVAGNVQICYCLNKGESSISQRFGIPSKGKLN